jgi:uncharacterized protein RhaS with RHS repeats
MRDYDPTLGRYITPDPIGIAGGLNRYTYAENNPLRWTDPTGEFVGVDDALAISGATVLLGIAAQYVWQHSGLPEYLNHQIVKNVGKSEEYCPTTGEAQEAKINPKSC